MVLCVQTIIPAIRGAGKESEREAGREIGGIKRGEKLCGHMG